MFGYNFREMVTTAEKNGKQIELSIHMDKQFIKAVLRTEDGVVRDTDNYLILRDYNREIVIPMASVVYMTVDERDYLSDKPRKNYISL
jgi:hypothetical protein